MFKWVNTGLGATGTRMGWGVEKKCGESPQTGSKVCEWAFSLREEEWLLAGHWEPHTQSQGRSHVMWALLGFPKISGHPLALNSFSPNENCVCL